MTSTDLNSGGHMCPLAHWRGLLAATVTCLSLAACRERAEREPPQVGTADSPAAVPGRVEVRATLTEWSVALEEDTVPAGPTTFRVTNRGRYEHQFEVEGNGQEEETGKIQPGGSATLSMDLRPGTYQVYCPITDSHGVHEELGMRTRLVVR